MPARHQDYPYAGRPRFISEFALVDGVGRAGKFMLANIVAGFERMEFFQEFVLLEHLLHLTGLGRLDFETCKVLLHTQVDILSYYMMIGRNFNARIHDLSCIHNAPEPRRFLSRSSDKDIEALIARHQEERRIPLFLAHDVLAESRIFWRVFPQAKILHILRHPVSLIHSWHKRGWGRRIGADPKAFDINFYRGGGATPWFALDWEKDYSSLPELDRVVYSVDAVLRKSLEGHAAVETLFKKRVFFLTFEGLLNAPREIIASMGKFLGSQETGGMEALLARERLPRNTPPEDIRKMTDEIMRQISADSNEILSRLVNLYESEWRRLATTF